MSDPFRMMSAVGAARQRYWKLPEAAHMDDPREAYARVVNQTRRVGTPTYEEAVLIAALALNLVAAVDRADEASITSGDAA